MEENRRRSPLRLLAPVALVVFALGLVVAVVGSNVDDGSKSSGDKQESTQSSGGSGNDQSASERRESELPADVYTVKAGDTLAAISDKTGQPVEKLQELNPELDPQALVSGQKIKLR
jgi:LysM repeat protein